MHTTDREVPPELQRRCAQALGAGFTRELATAHLPMLQDPVGLLAAVTDFTRAA